MQHFRHCEERSDEAIQTTAIARDWIASRSPSSGAHSRDPLARNDAGETTRCEVLMRQNLRQKLLRAITAGAAEEIGLQRVLDDLALVHEDDAMRYLAGKTHLMGDGHHGHAFACQIGHAAA